MMKKKVTRESSMSMPVSYWLSNRGYKVYTEVPALASFRKYDFVGLKETGDMIAVEMKTCLTEKVIRQAMSAQYDVGTVYCAVSSRPRLSGVGMDICRKLGFGVLCVINGYVAEILKPVQKPVDERRSNRLVEICLHLEPGGVTGLPCLKGVGPAQDVEKEVAKYREDHPHCTWQELWKEVPNHYVSAASMYGGMRMLELRRRNEERRRKKTRRKQKEKRCTNECIDKGRI